MQIARMKYLVGDRVKFKWAQEVREGTIFVADFMGSLENDYHSYDIKIESGDNAGLYKHLPEADVTELLVPAQLRPFDGDHLDMHTADGDYQIETASGSTYILRLHQRAASLQRSNQDHQLRKDGSEIEILDMAVERGRSAMFTLEPLGDGPVTTRITSRVVDVRKVN